MRALEKIPAWKKKLSPDDINRLIDRINILSKINTHSGIASSVSPLGVNLLMSGITNPIRKAYCNGAAGAATTIAGFLDVDATGPAITINCPISGGGNLNSCIRRLADGDLILVTLIGDDWWAIEGFQTSEDCDCYTA